MSHRTSTRAWFLVRVLIICLGGVFWLASAMLLAQSMPLLPASQVGFDEKKLDRVEQLVRQGILAEKMPGCVVCFGRQGKIAYLRAFGNRELGPEPIAMTVDTLFDLASITKPIATGTSVMQLVEEGRLRLGAKAADYLPEFGTKGKEAITIQDLLIHQSGLIPDNPLEDYLNGPQEAWRKICDLSLVAPVGTTFKYSDVNFIVLARIVEEVSGLDVHQFSQRHLFQPLGMTDTGFLPEELLRSRAAPTEKRKGEWIRGEVHDPRAYELGGIAGHAGLFSTAADLARYASMMLGRGTYHHDSGSSVQIMNEQTFVAMIRDYPVSSGSRGLSWDRRTGYSSSRGDLLSDTAFGHSGFAGTVVWIDPELDLFIIFLSNRVHPDGQGNVNPLVGQIANVVVNAIRTVPEAVPLRPEVLTGLDVLQRDGYRQLAGQRVGLITNHTGLNREGKSNVDLLSESPQVDLNAIFSPEHGFDGSLDTATIQDSLNEATGIRIHSLYGDTRRPTEAMCESIDTFVFDIQDVGTRFYTYGSTMRECMLAASQFKKRFVVLDRPNPIDGVAVAGPMLDLGKESFVSFHALPIRHGMTIGEIARMLNVELDLKLDLQIVPCEGWNRKLQFDSTGLQWVNPSPNMRNLTQALMYPGVGLLETTNVSVGRGTDTPFEMIGAPWIDSRKFGAALNNLKMPGVSFVPILFTPVSSRFKNEVCHGVNIAITDRSRFEPTKLGFALAITLRKLYPDFWETETFNRLLGNDTCYQAIVDGKSLEEVMDISSKGMSAFLQRRQSALLYR